MMMMTMMRLLFMWLLSVLGRWSSHLVFFLENIIIILSIFHPFIHHNIAVRPSVTDPTTCVVSLLGWLFAGSFSLPSRPNTAQICHEFRVAVDDYDTSRPTPCRGLTVYETTQRRD
jgi:hypothetical protein